MNKIRMRLVNADFWCEDDEVVTYTAEEALEEADDFLCTAAEEGLEYSHHDIEAVLEDGTVITYYDLYDLAKGEVK